MTRQAVWLPRSWRHMSRAALFITLLCYAQALRGAEDTADVLGASRPPQRFIANHVVVHTERGGHTLLSLSRKLLASPDHEQGIEEPLVEQQGYELAEGQRRFEEVQSDAEQEDEQEQHELQVIPGTDEGKHTTPEVEQVDDEEGDDEAAQVVEESAEKLHTDAELEQADKYVQVLQEGEEELEANAEQQVEVEPVISVSDEGPESRDGEQKTDQELLDELLEVTSKEEQAERDEEEMALKGVEQEDELLEETSKEEQAEREEEEVAALKG
eukprot:6178992-Pyramimonas_sp.AAC.1